jgi:SAM-dependent methyltransferase
MSLYKTPYYYDVAFGFRDISKEVDFFEQCIRTYSKIPVKDVLEIACGPSPYMIELAKCGYSFTGLDNSREMLDYSMENAKKEGIAMKTIHADMREFETISKFDFAFCMLGSLSFESNQAYQSHLKSMAKCLRQGGLYLIDGSIFATWPEKFEGEEWSITKKGLTIDVKYEVNHLDLSNQMITEIITLTIREDDKTKIIKEETKLKFLLLTELLQMITKNRQFEFIGRFNNFDINQPLEQATKINRPMTLLRKKMGVF